MHFHFSREVDAKFLTIIIQKITKFVLFCDNNLKKK